jgi:RimJ/RimL family protein N-acetyltransferase
MQQPIETARLRLRVPALRDARAIFERYSSDAIVTKYLGWPRHRTIDDARAFVALSDEQWRVWPAGPLLIEDLPTGALLGSTGLSFETADVAETGYVLARDAWGHGYATEAVSAVVALQAFLQIRSLYAVCHAENAASVRVVEKCGFVLESHLPRHALFPNLGVSQPQDCLRFIRTIQ